MVKNRGLSNRVAMSTAIKKDLWMALRKLSEDTRIPVSRLLDEAVSDLLKKHLDK